MSELSSLTDRIYEAAVDPGGWNIVLRQLAAMMDCTAAGITIEDPMTRRGYPITYFGFDSNHVEKTFDYFLPLNPLFAVSHLMKTSFIVGNSDVIDPGEFSKTDFYNGWAKPQGIGSPLTLVLDHGDDFYCPLTLVRPDGKGEATQHDRDILRTLSPHLTRAMRVYLKLQKSDAFLQVTESLFENLGLSIILLDEYGRITFTNRKGEVLLRDGQVFEVRAGVLTASDLFEERRLAEGIVRATSSPVTGSEFTMFGKEQQRLSVTIMPVPRKGPSAILDSLSATCAVVIEETDNRQTNSVRRMAAKSGLTPAELRVLEVILSGTGVRQAAYAIGISFETARSHLKHIFLKTGTTRQAELIRAFMDQTLGKRG